MTLRDIRWIVPIALLHLLVPWAGAQEAEIGSREPELERLKSQFAESVQPLLKRHCYRCHGAKRMKSGVRVDQLGLTLEDKELFLLQHIHKQLKEESMPPEDEQQLNKSERSLLLEK